MASEKVDVKFDILYKSGQKQSIVQSMTKDILSEIADIIATSMKNGVNGVIMLGKDIEKSQFINTLDISSVSFEVLKEGSNIDER